MPSRSRAGCSKTILLVFQFSGGRRLPRSPITCAFVMPGRSPDIFSPVVQAQRAHSEIVATIANLFIGAVLSRGSLTGQVKRQTCLTDEPCGNQRRTGAQR